MSPQNREMLERVAKGIVAVFGDRCEVVIHDFTDITHSLVHLEGNVTNRNPGAPATDTMMRMINEFGDQVPDKCGYKIITEDGKVLKCATIFVRDTDGHLEGCVAINFNITDFIYFSHAFDDLTMIAGKNNEDTRVDFAGRPAEDMESMIDSMLAMQGKAPSSMDKSEKKEIVHKLDKAGVFIIKGSVNYMAKVLGVSRFTVYNYLKEVREN